MKVLIISNSDLDGGAAKAAFRLHEAFIENGLESYMLVQHKVSADNSVYGPSGRWEKLSALVFSRLDHLITKRFKYDPYIRFSSAFTSHQLLNKIEEINPDIINLHWINSGFVSIEKIKDFKKPVVWTMHDMWAFTGGCHYDNHCEKYTDNCGKCPILQSNKSYDLSSWVFNRKKNSYPKIKKLVIVAVSKWLGECSERSNLLKNNKAVIIPNCIDIELFKPEKKDIARKFFKLPVDKPLIMFGSMGANTDKRKGYHLLLEALKELKGYVENFEFIIFGASMEQKQESIHNIKCHFSGSIKDEKLLALMYSAADVMVVPSLQENLSNVIMESLASGTPIVAFDIGGNKDLVEHKTNGYLAKAFDTTDLAKGIHWVIEDKERHQSLSENARNKILEKYKPEVVAEMYKELFSSTMAEPIQT